MTLANKFTIARIILVPVFVILAAIRGPELQVIATIVFVVASLTDMIDGQIARRYNQVTDFGKLVDPIADKLLACSAMLVLVEWGRLPAIIAIVLVVRDHIMNGIRLIAAGSGTVIPASWSGKVKTTLQMFSFICLLLDWKIIGYILLGLAFIMTLWSLYEYIVASKDVIQRAGATVFLSSYFSKCIVATLVIVMVAEGSMSQVVGIVFIGRDIIVSGVKATKGSGRNKAQIRPSGYLSFVVEMIAFILILLQSSGANIMLILALAAAALSAMDYLYDSREALRRR